MKIIKILKGGLVSVFLVALLLPILQGSAFGYAGIVKINSGILAGVPVIVFSGSKPNQTTPADSPSTNYTVETVGGYVVYNIYAAPSAATYLLLKTASTYSILPVSMGTTIPPTTTYDTATFYKMGPPNDPVILGKLWGYETAKVSWSLSENTDGTGFEYSGIELQLATDNGYANLVVRMPQNETLTSTSKIYSWALGELVDGRKLTSGTSYWFRVRGLVDGVAPSGWAKADFTMLAAVAGESTWNFFKGSNLAINQHELTVDPATTTISCSDGFGLGGYVELPKPAMVKNLVTAINKFAKNQDNIDNAVNAIGWWDSVTGAQGMHGYAIDYTKTPPQTRSDDSIQEDWAAEPLVLGRTYQFSVNGSFSGFKLKIK
ncbi:MAG: hypothetical protein WC632_04000 [Candidatus Margulisiibacteriota bacterium]